MVADDDPVILGGEWSPIGWSVGWLDAPLADVRTELIRWRRTLVQGGVTVHDDLQAWPYCLDSLLPLESPWTTELARR